MADPDKTQKVPRYSYDLIDMLDDLILPPEYPRDERMVALLNEAAVRAIAFRAGQRAVVQMLVDWRGEVEQEIKDALSTDDMAEESDDDSDKPFGTVLGPDGEEHQTVASTYVAARLVPEVSGDRDTPEE